MRARSGRSRQVTVQTRSVAADADGDPVESWAARVTVAAEVAPVGDEQAQAMQLDTASAVTVRMQWLVGLTLQDRLLVDGRTYEIRRLIEQGRGRGWIITAEEAFDGPRQSG